MLRRHLQRPHNKSAFVKSDEAVISTPHQLQYVWQDCSSGHIPMGLVNAVSEAAQNDVGNRGKMRSAIARASQCQNPVESLLSSTRVNKSGRELLPKKSVFRTDRHPIKENYAMTVAINQIRIECPK